MRVLMVLFLAFSFSLSAQERVNVYSEQDQYSITIYADNMEVIPMTIDLSLNLTGMKADFGGTQKKFVIPAKTSKYQLALVTPSSETGRMGVNFDSRILTGRFDVVHESEYIYDLPFIEGRTIEISQGYNGRFSHQGENALDFSMEIGEEVRAARGGTVFKIVENHDRSCASHSCQKYNNYVLIYHEDGTLAEYSHLQLNGAKVKIGDTVAKGQLIGYSGNTGWTSGPHLHFIVYHMGEDGKRISHRTKFRTSENGNIYLKEKKHYTK